MLHDAGHGRHHNAANHRPFKDMRPCNSSKKKLLQGAQVKPLQPTYLDSHGFLNLVVREPFRISC